MEIGELQSSKKERERKKKSPQKHQTFTRFALSVRKGNRILLDLSMAGELQTSREREREEKKSP